MAGADQLPDSDPRTAASPRLSAHRRADLDPGLASTATATTTSRSSPRSAAYASPTVPGRTVRNLAGSTTPKRSIELDGDGGGVDVHSSGTASGLNVSQGRHGAGGRPPHVGPRSSPGSPRRSLDAIRSAGGTPKPSPRLAAGQGQGHASSDLTMRNSPRAANAPTRDATVAQDCQRDSGLGSNGANSSRAVEPRDDRHSVSGVSSARRRPAPLDFAPELLHAAGPISDAQAYDGSADLAETFASMDIAAESTSAVERASDESIRTSDSPARSLGFDPSSSPVIETTIPSSRLSLSDALVLDTDGETTFSAASFLSSSTSTSASHASARGASSDHVRLTSHESVFGRARWPSGGMTGSKAGGLPFSASAAANLSSFATTTSPTTLTSYRSRATATGSLPVSPRSPPSSASQFSELSPGVDRGQLVGLGELATPRWTSGVLERRWDADSAGASHQRVLVTGETKSTPSIVDIDSPTIVRPSGRPLFARADSSFDTSNRPFGASSATSQLLPTSASTATLALDASPAGLLRFNSSASQSRLDAPYAQSVPSSPAGTIDIPRRRGSGQKSTASATTSAGVERHGSWRLASPTRPVAVGLGITDEGASAVDNGIATHSPAAPAASPARQQVSSSGAVSSASSRRSSGRPISLDGKTSGKALRRQSSGKSPFAHLPPSPAAARHSHVPTAPPGAAPAMPALPNLADLPHSPAASVNRPSTSASASASSTPSTRTPDHPRQPRHSSASHQASPSVIAASILRHTRDVEGVDVDIERAAAQDGDTAAALARLDGLNSPRLTRIASGERTRRSSRNAGDAPASSASRRTSVPGERRRTPSTPGAVETGQFASSVASSADPVEGADAFRSGPIEPGLDPAASADAPFPAAVPWKRGSSSSTSWTGGSFSQAGSLDSTSATSYATRSPDSKYQRSSAGSDVSCVQGTGDGRPALDRRISGDGSGTNAEIPPVPPLPKDWETYRPTVAGAQTDRLGVPPSPQVKAESSRSDKAPLPSPRTREDAPDPPEADRVSGLADPASPTLSAATASGHSRRKWSISSAFHKATRSPKASVKESTSFGDLQSMAGKRFRNMSTSHLGESSLPRRMASSTSNLSTLSSGGAPMTASPAATSTSTFGSLGKNSRRSGSFLRTRTSSYSSNATTLVGQAPQGPPAAATTSPGKSRSSVMTSRRTPSGIPFFSRRGPSGEGISAAAATSASLEAANLATPIGDEKSGRKSILGLNFRRSGGSGSKRDKDKVTLSPSSSARSTFSTSQSSLELTSAFVVDEFGRRASLAAPKVSAPSATTSRKRGKTVTSTGSSDIFRPADHAQLPPLHIRALPPQTAERVDALVPATQSSAPQTAPPRTRAKRLQDSLKANLPTIAGSPSAGSATHADLKEVAPSVSPPPKSHTPTRIPRLNRATVGVSPRTSPTLVTSKSARRLSSYGSLQSRESASLSGTARQEGRDRHTATEGQAKTVRGRFESDVGPSGIPRSRSTSSRLSNTKEATIKESVAAGPAILQADSSATPLRTRVPNLSASTSRLPSHTVASASHAGSASASIARSTSSQVTGQDNRRTSVPPAVSTAGQLPNSRSTRTLSTKATHGTRQAPNGTSARLGTPATDSGRSSSASGVAANDDELRGDEEMAAYVRRQRTKRLASGMDANSVRKLFEFPEPTQPLPPLSADEARSLYSRYLSPYERQEISEYRKIYFVGPNCDKKPATLENAASNHGYDDERGDYLMVPHDHIQYRYEIIDVLGKGSFGQVLQCRDHKTGAMVAVKIIRNKKRFHHQALVEVKVLENLVRWDPEEKHHVIRMIESFTFRGHLCIVTELLSINLYELVKANSFAGFSTTLIRRFTVQILGCLSLLRHHRVVHCDLKPENILLRHPSKSGVKVIDFGSSCFENEKVYTYIQSRFYRSPEVILGQNYHMSIDMWSLGCIMAEMYTGYPIFPGENEQEQLACIMEILGVPDKYLVDRSSRKRLFFDSTGAPRPVVNSKGRRRRPSSKTLSQVLKTDDELFVDFIAKCLAWDPDRRLKPDQALRHPWIAQARPTGQTASIASRASRGSATASGSALRQPTGTHVSAATISTPQRLKPSAPSTVSTAPHQRTRTASSTLSSSTSTARLGVKSSLPAPTRYSVKS
ncbi:hypothetical protein JCM3774_002722 [Rhodotorula dairenensis]